MRVSDAVGIAPVVFILPEDINLTSGSPKYHRSFLDMHISQISHRYLEILMEYQKSLKQRNALLKKIKERKGGEETLDIWDKSIAESAVKIIDYRVKFTDKINGKINRFVKKISGDTETAVVNYCPRLEPEKGKELESILEILKRERSRDIRIGTTLLGPHRDIIDIKLNDISLREYGSMGQKKSVMISLKLASLEVLSESRKEKAITIMDEAFAEFDNRRANSLLSLLSEMGQVFLASADGEAIDSGRDTKIFEVSNGTVKERK